MRTGIHLVFRLLLVACACVTLSSCGEDDPVAHGSQELDAKLLATDVHVEIAQHALVLPLGALQDYAYGSPSFSLDRKGDSERAKSALDQLLKDSADPKHPVEFDSLTVTVRTGSSALCRLLIREWARAACDNPWGPIHQALPANRFNLVDLSRLQIGNSGGLANCMADSLPRRPLPASKGEVEVICKAQVSTSSENEFHTAVVRIDGDLGALWTVWRYGQKGETAAAMAQREGQAIIAWVQHGLMSSEDYSVLHSTLCGLKRPDAMEDPRGPPCRKG